MGVTAHAQVASAGAVYSPKNFGFEIVCSKGKGPLRLIALIKTEDVAKKLLKAMHLPTKIPELRIPVIVNAPFGSS